MKGNILGSILLSTVVMQQGATISSTLEMVSDDKTVIQRVAVSEDTSQLNGNNIKPAEEDVSNNESSTVDNTEQSDSTAVETPSSEEVNTETSNSDSGQRESQTEASDSPNTSDTSSSESKTEDTSGSTGISSSDGQTSDSSSTEKPVTPPKDDEEKPTASKEDKEKYTKELNGLSDLSEEFKKEYFDRIEKAKDVKELDAILKEAKETELGIVRGQTLEELYGLDSLSHAQFSDFFSKMNNAKSKEELKTLLKEAKTKNEEEKYLKENIDKLLERDKTSEDNSNGNVVVGGSYGTGDYDFGGSSFTRNLKTDEFIKAIALQAHEDGQKNDLFASITIAQAILESGSGNSSLSQPPNNNLFGIKGSYEGKSTNMPTLEDDGSGSMYTISSSFRIYPSYKESIEDHSKLLTKGIDGNPNIYKGAWKSEAKTYQASAKYLQGRYATDTSYANKLTNLIKTYDLDRFDKKDLTDEDMAYIKSFDLDSITKSSSENDSNRGTYVSEIPTEFKRFLPSTYKNSTGGSQSGNRYPVGECTWYAYNRVFENGQYIEWFSGDGGNGGFWGDSAKANGYEVNNEPKTGKLVSFKPGVMGYHAQYGHIAYVEAVNDKGDILISESGGSLPLTGSFKIIEKAQADKLVYITPK